MSQSILHDWDEVIETCMVTRSVIIYAFILCLSGQASVAQADGQGKFSFFIVGDAHIGWQNKMQPTLDQQRGAMRTILSTFPDLDFFIDAGDNTHPEGGETARWDAMRRDWMAVEPNACLGIPFLYASGNHEIMHFQERDPEAQCSLSGSLPCRPYYSVTRKGIHLIMLPEMSRTVFLTAELLDWLRLDLAAHKRLTTIIVTHNSILNTTGGDEPGYRGLAQNELLLDLFRRNPQIIAWMHGHNHDYVVVPREGMLFISVGRIGGFSYNVIPLGGMYVEVTAAGMTARGFNAETGKFLEGTRGNINALPVSGTLKQPTSFDAQARTAIGFGLGRDQNGAKTPVFNHFTGGIATAWITREKSAVLNDNPDFSLYAERQGPQRVDRQLFGYGFRAPERGVPEVAPGKLVLPLNGKEGFIAAPDFKRSFSYYHAVPGKPYRATVEITAPGNGGTIQLGLYAGSSTEVADETKPLAQETFELKPGRATYSVQCLMKSPGKTVYDDPASSVLPTLMAVVRMRRGMPQITVHSFVIARADAAPELKPGLAIDGKPFAAALREPPEGLWSAPLGDALVGARAVVETLTGGCSSWLVSKEGVDWQVRNATVTERKNSLLIQTIDNPWVSDEILLAPLFGTTEPYLAKSRGVHSLEIFPVSRGNRTLRVDVHEAGTGAMLTIKAPVRPRLVTGTRAWEYRNGYVEVQVDPNAMVEIEE